MNQPTGQPVDPASVQYQTGPPVVPPSPAESAPPAHTPPGSIPPAQTPRALAPDLARGFMLLFIALANVSAYLWGRDGVTGFELSLHPTDGTPLDNALAALVILFVDGRIYPMFAFLFGYGIMQFTMSRLDRGVPFDSIKKMLLRRHLWLIVFGAVHAILLFAGDILGAYGLSGLILAALLLRAKDRTLKIIAWVTAGVAALFVLSGAGIMLLFSAVIPPELMQLDTVDAGSFDPTSLMNDESNYLLGALFRFGLWIGSSIGAVLTLLIPLMILLGGLAARHRWLETPVSRLPLGRVAFWGILIAALAALPQMLVFLGVWQIGEFASISVSLVSQSVGLLGGVGYAALFALIGLKIQDRGSALTRAIAALGKRSLTFYLLQSVVFAPLLAAWGFGLGAEIGTAAAYAIALGVWVLSLVLATALEMRGRRGPAEVVLRRLTYGKSGLPVRTGEGSGTF